MHIGSDLAARLVTARRMAAVGSGVSLGLAAALVLIVWRPRAPIVIAAEPLVRREAARLAAQEGFGLFDSHPDSEVARVMLPGLQDRLHYGVSVSTNRLGMREREYELPKPAGLVRVVVLGDSFVFGSRAPPEDRVGDILERLLREQLGTTELEVLSIAVASWNIRAECAYLRRQLSLLEPDLVLQIVIANDLDDIRGARGMGFTADWSPRHPDRAMGLVAVDHPLRWMGVPASNFLLAGLDWESRERYAAAATSIADLADAVRRGGGRYLLLVNWLKVVPVARERLLGGLREDEYAFVSSAFATDKSNWLADDDGHWNADGALAVAQLVYALAAERELLPGRRLPPLDEARARIAAIHEVGRAESLDVAAFEEALDPRSIRSAVRFDDRNRASARQVHAGVVQGGGVMPYASMILAQPAAATVLRIRGRYLDRDELAGARIDVLVDDAWAGALEVTPGASVDAELPLPQGVRGREFVSVRFLASDFVYVGDLLELCISFVLETVALE